jgi:DNA polymerase III epsilon subunit-like protein
MTTSCPPVYTFIGFDSETTGRLLRQQPVPFIISLGAAFHWGDTQIQFHETVNPQVVITDEISSITGLKNEELAASALLPDVLEHFLAWVQQIHDTHVQLQERWQACVPTAASPLIYKYLLDTATAPETTWSHYATQEGLPSGIYLVTYNGIGFDLPILYHHMLNLSRSPLTQVPWLGVVDVLSWIRQKNGIIQEESTVLGVRQSDALHFHTDRRLENVYPRLLHKEFQAHNAAADASATLEVAVHLLQGAVHVLEPDKSLLFQAPSYQPNAFLYKTSMEEQAQRRQQWKQKAQATLKRKGIPQQHVSEVLQRFIKQRKQGQFSTGKS